MDAYGHVNNVQYLRLLEDARVIAFHGHGSDDGGNVVETGILVASQAIEYLRPLHYRPEPVAIDLWVSSIGGASFDMQYEVLDDEPDRVVYARAESTLVLYDLKAGRPRRFTDDERARMERWLDEPIQLRRSSRSQ